MNLSTEELARYQRHLSLAGFGPSGQLALKKSRVLVIGAGGLGCPALLYLAAAGVGQLTVIDPDRVEVSNLQRQILFTTEDAGELKVAAAARRLRALNPSVEIITHAERFNRNNALDLLQQVDLVLDGSDNFSTRYLVSDACELANKPLIYGAIHGFEGQVSVFNFRNGPTYRCLFPEPPEPGSVPNCAEGGVLGVLPGLIGTMQACEAIKVLAGIGEPLSGRLWLWNALSMTAQVLRISVDPNRRKIVELPPEGYAETCAVISPQLEIDKSELISRLALPSGAPQLLDVREEWERAQGAIFPSAHMPLGTLEKAETGSTAFLAAHGLDPERPTVVYCAAGGRSLRGAVFLREKFGLKDVVSLRGGYKGWLRPSS